MLMAEEEEANETDEEDEEDDEDEANNISRFGYGWPLPSLDAAVVPEAGGEESLPHKLRLEGSMCSTLAPGLLLTSCTHAAHLACWQEYMAGLQRRVVQQESFEGEGLVRPQRGEFLCPVCRGVSNVLLPLAYCEECDVAEVATPAHLHAASQLESSTNLEASFVQWASGLLSKLEQIRISPPQVSEHGKELRRQLEDFHTFCTCMQGKLPQMSLSASDCRARHMPAALLSHNAAVSELLWRCSSTPTSTSENEIMRLKLRALWLGARSSARSLSAVATFLLQLTALSSVGTSDNNPPADLLPSEEGD